MLTPEGRPLYLAEQVRELDRRTIASGINGFELMQRAAMAAYDALRARWPRTRRLSVVCGGGNNAGDGYVIAALAVCDGIDAQLVAVRDPTTLTGDAARAREMAEKAGLRVQAWAPDVEFDGDVVVDALLGTGLNGEVREPFRGAIEAINASRKPVLAVDIPSGLSADSGAVLGCAVDATLTVTFIGDKLGLHTGAAVAHVGEHRLEALGVDVAVHDDLVPAARLLDIRLVGAWLPPRRRDSHKGHYGHVLVLGGAPGFGGAALLASECAARLGAGLISLATAPEHVTASLVRCPEVMVRGVRSATEISELLKAVDVLVVGPGLAQGSWGQAMLQAALGAGKPLVLDADALNLLAKHWPQLHRDDWILTPHPGEAARLLGTTTAQIQADRSWAVRELQRRRGGCVILKGAGSLIAGPAGVGVCPYGNPGMASGGMGDALSGMLGALVAQRLPCEVAARLGAVLHASAADAAAQAAGERGLLASDLACYARRLANPRNQDAGETR
ncbi:bifunctional NAD(P)H-hydrate repair enzyme [Litchfieldella qijiaojingensis]|uniref:Bifunctional NAD(P)H-hydrate repair enzyme n=1 Tax=Litchfieldella qijiaojingensis TaxID=980347 RepID=A0ABQ2YXD5_9GAMM|nr:NAD(P)H-hydrate dehydratase [Halomonas qijiaojingensis]GGX95133.1 bifunctional NAD(P)H-hydrate repair enzyme [Halomonas qijiaojingensis]